MSDARFDARFELACSRAQDLPPPTTVEVAVVGRSNCGKSSLINAVTGQARLARTSSTPGRTRQLVFFRLLAGGSSPFYLVDLPGYGYAKASKSDQREWAELINHYIDHRPTLAGMLLLADIRRQAGQEEQDLLRWCRARDLRTVVVLTKADKLNKSQRFAAAQRAKRELGIARRPLVFSVQDRPAIAAVRQELLATVEGVRASDRSRPG